MSIRVDGIEDVLRAFKQVERAAQADVLEDASLYAVEPIRSRAAQNAPVRTGRLVRGIMKETAEKRHGYVEVDVGPHADEFYALFIEKGWRPGGRSSKTKHTVLGKNRKGEDIMGGSWSAANTVSPRPFLRPAVDEQKGAVFAMFRQALVRWFDRIQ